MSAPQASARWFREEASSAVASLRTDPDRGITEEEAKARLAQAGPNLLVHGRRVTFLGVLLEELFEEPRILFLLAVGVLYAVWGSPGPVLAVGHSYGGAVITNAATNANNVVGLVYVCAFAPDEGETLRAITSNSKDSVLMTAQMPLKYPTGEGKETAVEFAIDPEKFHDAFAADLPAEQSAVMAATQRPIAESAFSEPNGVPAWKKVPSWAVVATGDRAAGADVVRSMAERAGATITEVEGSHVIMISQPQVVTDVILTALAAAT